MSLHIYKPKRKEPFNGSAGSFSYNEKLDLYIQIIKQATDGGFKANIKSKENSKSVKLSLAEATGIIRAIEHPLKKEHEFSTVHKTETTETQIVFKAYAVGEDEKLGGYGLKIVDNKSKATFMLSLSVNEGLLVKHWLINYLNKKFDSANTKVEE